jgi:CHAT domain-containing protein
MDPLQAARISELSQSIRSRSELLASGIKGKQRTDAERDIEEHRLKIEEIRLLFDLEHIIDRQVWSDLAEAEPLQKKMAEDHMTLAEFELGEKRSYLWLFTGAEMYFELLPSRQEIENELKPYLEQISTQPKSMYLDRDLKHLTERSQTLFDKLFGRSFSRIEPGQKLIIVPDGMLNYLPFESLIHDGRYLIEDHEISYSRSASFLLQPQNTNAQPQAADKMELIAFGDPLLGKPMGDAGAVAIKYAGTSRALNLPSIPRSRDEVLCIAGLFPADRTRVYVGRDGSEEVLKHESLRRYRRLHFATHAVVDEQTPAGSAVVLTPSADEDGLLQVSEISELDLDCDLVVLSACRTGRGQLVAGEGIIGLARAFLYAGARSVVISLWNVPDISTSHLMKNFYQGLSGHRSTADALRQAKLVILRSAGTRHPYYWASFVSVGKP